VIRWLVVGAGGVGRAHAAAIRGVAGAALAGVVSLDPVADPGVPVFVRLSDAIDALRPDAAVIATPHDTHLELGLQALAAGVPVLFEKPVGLCTGDAEALVERALALGTPAGAVLNQRACRHQAWIAALARSGRLSITSVAFGGSLARLSGWHADPARAGGGLLRIIGVHYVDLLRWWLGEPAAVAALLSGTPAEDRIAVALAFPGGALGSLQLSATAARSLGPVRTVIEAGDARIELAGHAIQRVEGLPDPPALEPANAALPYGPGHLEVIRAATEALAAARPFPVPLAELLPTLRLVDRIQAAAAAAVVAALPGSPAATRGACL
jgi:predicted dehydrogenase